MSISNGYVPDSYLVTFQGVKVAACIYPDLSAAGRDFRARGYTFSLALPWGGNRPFDIQNDMRAAYLAGNYSKYNLSPPPSPVPGVGGTSRHGFAKAVDVISNAPVSVRDSIMADHGFHLWSTNDRNHYEWNNALTADGLVPAASLGLTSASSGSTALDSSSAPAPIRRNPHMTTIVRIYRAGVGEFIMYASPSAITVSPELSTNPSRRAFELNVAHDLRVAMDLPGEVPLVDDTANGGWYYRDQIAATTAGMPSGYDLTPDKPFIPAHYYQAGSTVVTTLPVPSDEALAAIAKAVNDDAAERLKA